MLSYFFLQHNISILQLILYLQNWVSGTHVFVLSGCLSVAQKLEPYPESHNFWTSTVRDGEFTFGMQTKLMKPFQMA